MRVFLKQHLTRLGLILLLWPLAACAPSLPQHPDQLTFPELEFQLPDVERLELANGIRLYLKEDEELPLVQVTALVGAGSIGVSSRLAGFADIYAEVWRTGGTAETAPAQLENRLDSLAADLNASMETYTSQLDLSIRREDFGAGLQIMADLLRSPAFSAKSLELARLKAIENVRRQNDLPAAIAQRLMMASLYPGHPLGESPTIASLQRIERRHLETFHADHFRPNNLMLAVSGDFDRQQLLEQLADFFGDWPAGEVAEQPLPPVPESRKGTIQVVDKDLTQTTIRIGDVGLTKDNPDQYAVRVMNFILGGGGFNSRLMQEVRSNRGLAYSAYSYFQIGRRLPGPFIAGTETRNASVAQALGLMRDIMGNLRDNPVSKEELRTARESLVNSFVFGFEDSHAVVSQQMRLDFFGYPEDYLQGYRARIAAVTVADVQRVAKRYLHPGRQQIVLVGDAEVYAEDLASFGQHIEMISVDEAL